MLWASFWSAGLFGDDSTNTMPHLPAPGEGEKWPCHLGNPTHLGSIAPLCPHGCLRLWGYLQKENRQLHHGDNGIL